MGLLKRKNSPPALPAVEAEPTVEKTIAVERSESAPSSETAAPAPQSVKGKRKKDDDDERAPLLQSLQDKILILIAGISFLIAGYFLFFGMPRSWFANMQVIGEIESSTSIRRRHSGTLSWQTLNGTNKIYLRDIVYVPKDSTASVKFGAKSFTLPADTMVQFDESSIDQFEITLLELKTNNTVPMALPVHKANLSNLLPELSAFELRLSELKARTFSSIYEAAQLAKAFPMLPNQFALEKISDYEIRLVEPQPERYNLRAFRWMKMSWSPVPLEGVSYVLEVSKDSRFRRNLPYKTKTNKLLVQFDDEATFYWRVRGTKGNDETISEALSFTMVIRGGKTPTLKGLKDLTGKQE